MKMKMSFILLAFICFIVCIIYAMKIIINVIKKRKTDTVQESVFWGTLVGIWGFGGLGSIVDDDIRSGFTLFAMIPFSALLPCFVRLLYLYLKKKMN